jgi:hypothetical protein
MDNTACCNNQVCFFPERITAPDASVLRRRRNGCIAAVVVVVIPLRIDRL